MAGAFLLLTSVRDLQWRLRRFVAAMVATALVFALTVLLSGFLEHFDREIDRTLDALGADAYVVAEGGGGPFTSLSPIPADTAERVAQEVGATTAPIITLTHTVDQSPPLDIYLVGHRLGDMGSPPVRDGRAAGQAGEAVVDEASMLDLGDRFVIGGHELTVVGRSKGLTVLGELPNVYVALGDAQAIVFGGQPLATSVLVKGAIDQPPTGLVAIDRAGGHADLERPMADTVESIKLFRLLLWIVAAGIVGSVLYISALERSGEMAVHKATGVSSRTLIAGLSIQALVLTVGASVFAIGLALVLAPVFPAGISLSAGLLAKVPLVALSVGLVGSIAGSRRTLAIDPAVAFGGGVG